MLQINHHGMHLVHVRFPRKAMVAMRVHTQQLMDLDEHLLWMERKTH